MKHMQDLNRENNKTLRGIKDLKKTNHKSQPQMY